MKQLQREKRKFPRTGSVVWAIKRLWKTAPQLLICMFLNIPFRLAVPLVTSLFSKVLIDALEKRTPAATLAAIVLGFMFGILGLTVIEAALRSYCQIWKQYPANAYRTEMFELVNDTMDYETTESQDFQKISQYAFRDAAGGSCSAEVVWRDLWEFLIALAGMITYGSLLGALHPVLFTVVLIVSVASYATTRWQPVYFETNKHHFEKEARKIGYLGELSENFSTAKDIKLYGLSKWLENMLRDYQNYILFWEKKCSFRGVLAAVVSALMSLIQNGTAYVFLIMLLFNNKLSVGDFVFYFGLTGSIAGYLNGIIKSWANLSSRADKINYYRELFSYPNRQNVEKGCALPKTAAKIEFRDVWYRYNGAQEDTLKGVSFTIEAGESIALVGLNGAGKTTLVKLLCGFYHPTRGEIFVNDKNISEYNIRDYHSLISAVFQEIWPVAFTIFNFVASADPERDNARKDAVLALQKAGIWEKIKTLPNGMDTHLMKGIYDDGVDFSGGEMQKLVLARAIYKNGLILVLDEPTSALDPITENKLYLQYRMLTAQKTSLYISHRFASTRFCDRILLLDQGVIRESGSHEELMLQNGLYAQLFHVQAKYYQEEINHAERPCQFTRTETISQL